MVAESFISLLTDVTDKNDLLSWSKILAFARCCLSQPLKSEENKKKTFATLIKSQTSSFLADDLQS